MSGSLPARLARAALCLVLAVALALPRGSWAFGPFEKNHPLVEEGIIAYEQGRYEDALRAFDEAKKELPHSAALEFNRGNALYKLGRIEEAKAAYHRVIEADQTELRQKDYYNLGNAWARLGNTKEAITAYRKALTLDPRDEQARHNLEVVLRKLPPPPQSKPDGGTDGGSDGGQDGGRPDAGRDGGMDGGQDGGDGGTDGGRGDGGQGDGGQGDGGQESEWGEGREDGGQTGERPEDSPDGGGQEGELPDGGIQEIEDASLDGGTEADISKRDAERLLDSMKQGEKNLQLWRFQQKRKKRRPHEKDW